MVQATWFYEKRGEAIGPFTKEQLQSFYKSGVLEDATLVWQNDTQKLPAVEVLEKELRPLSGSDSLQQAPDLPIQGKPPTAEYADNWETTPPRIFRRLFSQLLDLVFFSAIVGFVGGVVLAFVASNPSEAMAKVNVLYADLLWQQVINLFFVVSGLFLSALSLNLTGSTPGAYIFGLRILKKDYSLMSYGKALKRQFLMLLWGCGLMIPVVVLVMPIVAFFKIRKHGYAVWDKKAETICIYKKSSKLAIVMRTLAAILLVLVLALFR